MALYSASNGRYRGDVAARNSRDGSNTVNAVHTVKQQIDTLTEKQIDALKHATYLGMTPDEAQDYDERRKTIVKLVAELKALTAAQ
jgi:hypothetical protein